MRKPFPRLTWLVAAAGGALVASFWPTISVASCDAPGTPNHENSVAISPTSIRLSWNNTASERGVYFDIEGRSDPSIANYGPYNGTRGSTVEYQINNLTTNTRHCYRIWARTEANGCRSNLPSAWTCATPTSTSRDPRDMGTPGIVLPPPHRAGGGVPPGPPIVVPMPRPFPTSTCLPLGGSCSSTDHCCNDAHLTVVPADVTPALCVYGTCKQCVPHGAECQANGSQICCDINDNCKLDQSSGKTVCDIVDGPSGKRPIFSGQCVQGFVWREARPSDHVCVTPQIRSETAQDNARAERERCVPGHVWREAYEGDHVCVTPQVRGQAWDDNSKKETRTVH